MTQLIKKYLRFIEYEINHKFYFTCKMKQKNASSFLVIFKDHTSAVASFSSSNTNYVYFLLLEIIFKCML